MTRLDIANCYTDLVEPVHLYSRLSQLSTHSEQPPHQHHQTDRNVGQCSFIQARASETEPPLLARYRVVAAPAALAASSAADHIQSRPIKFNFAITFVNMYRF